jgi:DNA modification methylase
MSTNHFPMLSVESVPLDRLKPDPRNPRAHTRRQVKQIARSIETFGFNVPILADRDNNVIAGHGRVLAGQHIGLAEVPVIRLEHLTPAAALAFRIADNRLAENSCWDEHQLAESLKELSGAGLNFDIEAIGFDMGEIDFRIESLQGPVAETEDASDNPLPAGPPVSRPGDLWLLGKHRLYCGNAIDPEAYRALMNGERAALVFTDPPYNVNIVGHASGLGKIRHREFAMASGEMTTAEFTGLLTLACTLLARNSVDGSIHFICMDWRHAADLLAAGKLAYSDLKNICVWTKHNAGMGSFYRSQHEFVFVFKAGRAPHRNNIQLGQHGRNRSNVWSYPGANSFGRATEEGHLLYLHPTVKPIRLVADAILDCSARDEIVLDTFLGSGTTLVAAERTGRRCYGMEIDPLYADTAVRRWQAYTGAAACHAVTRATFNSIEQEMRHHADGR